MNKMRPPAQRHPAVEPTKRLRYLFITHILTAVGFLVLGFGLGTSLTPSSHPTATIPSSPVPPTTTPEPRFTVEIDDDPAIGPETAPVTVVIFSDFTCTFCGYFARITWPPLLDTYRERVRFVYRDYPITNALSVTAAIAAECAADQGQFWAYHDRLFTNASLLTDAYLLESARALGLDEMQFTTCLNDPSQRDEVLADYAAGQALGLTGAPTVFINGRRVQGAQPYGTLSQIIDDELAQAGG